MLRKVQVWLFPRHGTKWQIFRRLAPVVLLIFALMVQWRARNIHGVSRVSAQTELVSFTVINPDVVAIPVRGVRVASGPAAMVGQCISGSLSPVLNAKVDYGRAGWGPPLIRVGLAGQDDKAAAALYTAWGQDERIAMPAPVELLYDPACKLPAGDDEHVDLAKTILPYNLPIFGRATLGSEAHAARNDYPEPATLMTATVTVSARTISLPLISPERLYQVDTFDIPVGSRVDARLDSGGRRAARKKGLTEDAEEGASWAGVAYLDTTKPGLSVEVETDTTSLRIVRPNSSEPDMVEVTGFKEVFEDPGLIILYKTLFVLGLVLTLSGWIKDELLGESLEKEQLKLLGEIKECLRESGK